MNKVEITFFEQIEFVNLENEIKSWVSFNACYGFIWVKIDGLQIEEFSGKLSICAL